MAEPRGRLAAYCGSLPVVNRLVLGVCVAVYFYTPLLYPAELFEWDFCVYLVVYRGEWYRALTGTFLHGGVLHIAMNMFTMLSLGVRIEQAVGSLALTGLTALFTLANAGLEIAIRIALFKATGDVTWTLARAVGFSGVLFSFIIIHTKVTRSETYNLCGFQIPAWVYPWVLLVGISFIIPNASFVGHLCGLLMGIAYVKGYLNCLLPKRSCQRAFEAWPGFDRVTGSLVYSKCPVDPPIPEVDAWGNWGCGSCAVGDAATACARAIRERAGCCVRAAGALCFRQSAYQQISQDPEVGVEMGPPALDDGFGEVGDIEEAMPTSQQDKKATNGRPARETPCGRSRLLDTVPRMKPKRGQSETKR